MNDERRIHGFQLPFHPLQLVSWVVFGSDVLAFCIFHIPLIDGLGWKTLVAVCFSVSVLVLVIAAAKATRCDPADPNVYLQKSDLSNADWANLPYCTLCNVPVHERSKHCRACNKCVHGFDHHCMWLNTCIGEANYGAFLLVIWSVAVMISCVLGTVVYLLIDCISNADGLEARLEDLALLDAFSKEAILGVVITMIVVNLPLLILDIQLVCLHAFLASQGLTTYEYIMGKRSIQLEAERGLSDNVKKNKGDTKISRRIHTLPNFMDWIVFRPSKKRSGQHGKKVQRIEHAEEPTSDGEPANPECDFDMSNQHDQGQQPTPPGSTTTPEDAEAACDIEVGLDGNSFCGDSGQAVELKTKQVPISSAATGTPTAIKQALPGVPAAGAAEFVSPAVGMEVGTEAAKSLQGRTSQDAGEVPVLERICNGGSPGSDAMTEDARVEICSLAARFGCGCDGGASSRTPPQQVPAQT